MNKVPYFNDSDRFVHIGAVTIPPRETRDVDERLLPGYQAPQSGGQSNDDPLMALSALSVGRLELGLPDLNDEELARLDELEKAKDKPRQGALAAITAERLRRAEKAAPGGLPDEKKAEGEGGQGTGGQDGAGQTGSEGQGQ